MADPWALSPPVGAVDPWGLSPSIGVDPTATRTIEDIGDAILGGLQVSSGGLAYRKKVADRVLADDAPWYHRAAYGLGQIGGDVPAMIAGAAAGGVAATAVTANPLAGAIGAGAGAFAAPMAIREALMEAYNTGHAVSWEDAWSIAKAGLKGGLKGAVIGAVTGGAGAVVGRAVGTTLAPGVGTAITGQTASRLTGSAIAGTELATMVTASAALEGKIPTAQDFIDNAILLGGIKGAVHVTRNLRNIYAATGKHPAEVVGEARADPALKADIMEGKPGEIPAAYKPASLEQQIEAAVKANAKPEEVRKILTDPNWKPNANDPPPVVTEYITDRASMVGIYGEVARVHAKEIESITRGTRTNQATMAEAYSMVFGGRLEEHVAGMAANAETMAARLIVAKSALLEAAKATERLKDNPLDGRAKLEFYASIERLSQMQKEARGATAEWGRAGQIQRAIKRDPSMLIDAETLLANVERKMPIGEVMRLFDQMKDPSNRLKFAEEYMKASTKEKIMEAWRAGLFSGPLTTEANLLGNTGRFAVEAVKAPLQASLFALDRAVHGDPLKMAQFTARAFAPFYGLKLAVMDGLHLAERGAALLKEEGGLKKIGEAIADVASKNDERIDVHKRANTGAVGKFVGFSFGLLKLGDLPFRTIGERAEAYTHAIDRAVKEFHPGSKEFREAVAKYVQEPTFGLAPDAALKITKAIDQAGAEAVFAQRMGARAEKVSSAISGTYWQLVFPAIKTPVNLLDYALQHTPGLNFLSSRWREDWAAGGERKAAATARVVVGAGIAAVAYSLAEDGLLTGGNLTDKETGGARTGAGVQPYSIKIGDNFYSIQRLEPVAKIAMLAADLIEIMNSPKITEEDSAKAKAMLILAFANATISTTYLSGLSNLMKAALDPERYGNNLVESYGSTIVPKIVGQSVTMADPYKREVDGLMDSIQGQIPFLREKLLAKRDVWGERVKNEKLFGVMPLQQTEASKDKVKTEAVRLWLGIADAPKFLMESGPLSAQDKRAKLSGEQRDVFREVSGKMALEILSPIVNSPDWDRLPDFAKVEVYRDVLKDTRIVGKETAAPADSAMRVKLREQIVEKLNRQITEPQSSSGERRVK